VLSSWHYPIAQLIDIIQVLASIHVTFTDAPARGTNVVATVIESARVDTEATELGDLVLSSSLPLLLEAKDVNHCSLSRSKTEGVQDLTCCGS
jgi:hypothetical protein